MMKIKLIDTKLITFKKETHHKVNINNKEIWIL